MSGMAVRIGQRMGLHAETHNKEYSPFEAEMRRRTWWQVVLFDSRIGEMAGSKDLGTYSSAIAQLYSNNLSFDSSMGLLSPPQRQRQRSLPSLKRPSNPKRRSN